MTIPYRKLGLTALVLFSSVLVPITAIAQANDVFISEYIEGSSNNKAIELYNGTDSAIDLTAGAYSLQFFFNGSTSAGTTINLTGSVAPGDVFVLAQGSADAAILAQADQTNSGSWFNGDDAIVLRKGQAIIDSIGQIGFDPGSEWGSELTSTADNTLRRKAAICIGDTATDDNFDPALQWDGFATNIFDDLGAHSVDCGGNTPINPSATATASPSSVLAGETTLLTATVTPGRNPDSTGIIVTVDVSSLGSSVSQAMLDDGTNGDAVAGDGTYSTSVTIASGTSGGSRTLAVTISDAQQRSAMAEIALSIVSVVPIHSIQGNGRISPLLGSPAVTEGIVTAIRTNGFYIQMPDSEADADPMTSQGIFVFTGNGNVPAAAVLGNRLRVAGTVSEFTPSSNPGQLSLGQLTNATVSILSSGNPLPQPVVLTAQETSPTSALDYLERYEGMRVAIDKLDVVAPVTGFIDEDDAVATLGDAFYGVISANARPFREAGISELDIITIPPGIMPPRFDTNPERIRVDTDGQLGATRFAVDVGASITNLTGVLDYGFGAYTLLPDPNPAPAISGGNLPRPALIATADEVTIGSFNLQRFFDDVNDPDVGEPVLKTEAYQRRLRKAASAICGFVNAPDILGVVEVENIATLTALAQTINSNATGSCADSPQYQPYLEEGNDPGGIDVGFLIRSQPVVADTPRVVTRAVTQFGKDDTLANPDGSTSILNDRPPLLLQATINRANGSSLELTVIANHLRSLSGLNSTDPGSNGWATDGERIRAKRAAQAQFLAQLVEARQQADSNEKIVLLGDFNAFEFNDGYADVMGIITGREAAQGEVLTYLDSPITTPLTNVAELLPASERYSFSFDGNAQSLDHILVNSAVLGGLQVRADHARINADFAIDNYGDDTVPVRVSDHDPVVVYLSEKKPQQADLRLNLSGPRRIRAGDSATVTAQISNHGPNAAQAPVAVIFFDGPITQLTPTTPANWRCDPRANSPRFTLECRRNGELASGSRDSIDIRVSTERKVFLNALVAGAAVSSPTPDKQRRNNADFYFGIITGF